jgi:hypothetical protein
MRIKTSELSGAALDWAVAKCEGYQAVFTNGTIRPVFRKAQAVEATWPEYSTDWAQGGPVIEREKILIQPEIGKEGCANAWSAISMQDTEAYGPTPLIAAMRCYVASKLGDEVDVPEELTNV